MERSTITIDEFGNVILPNDTTDVWMNESELLDLFGVTAPTVRAGIKALCKSGALREYEIKRTIRLSDKCSMEFYNLETIIALAFHFGTFGAKRVRNAIMKRLYLRKQNDFLNICSYKDFRYSNLKTSNTLNQNSLLIFIRTKKLKNISLHWIDMNR